MEWGGVPSRCDGGDGFGHEAIRDKPNRKLTSLWIPPRFRTSLVVEVLPLAWLLPPFLYHRIQSGRWEALRLGVEG